MCGEGGWGRVCVGLEALADDYHFQHSALPVFPFFLILLLRVCGSQMAHEAEILDTWAQVSLVSGRGSLQA